MKELTSATVLELQADGKGYPVREGVSAKHVLIALAGADGNGCDAVRALKCADDQVVTKVRVECSPPKSSFVTEHGTAGDGKPEIALLIVLVLIMVAHFHRSS